MVQLVRSWRPAIKKLLVQAMVAAAMLVAAGGAWWFFYFEQPQAEGAAGPAGAPPWRCRSRPRRSRSGPSSAA